MLWATSSHLVFEVVCFSRPWSLLPCQYFISLKAVFPSVHAYNWGIAAINVQLFLLNSAEFCDKYIRISCYVCISESHCDVYCMCVCRPEQNNMNTDTHTLDCSCHTERCEMLICIACAWQTFIVDSIRVKRRLVICVWFLRGASLMKCINAKLICLLHPRTQKSFI